MNAVIKSDAWVDGYSVIMAESDPGCHKGSGYKLADDAQVTRSLMADAAKLIGKQSLRVMRFVGRNRETIAYEAGRDSLEIWRNGDLVYANDAGTICKDRAALADSI